MQHRSFHEQITPYNSLQMNWATAMLPILVGHLSVGVVVAQAIGVKILIYKLSF